MVNNRDKTPVFMEFILVCVFENVYLCVCTFMCVCVEGGR